MLRTIRLLWVVPFLLALSGSATGEYQVARAAAALQITETPEAFTVASGAYQWTIAKTRFTVLQSVQRGDTELIHGGESSVDYLDGVSSFGPPQQFSSGSDWVELRGWVDAAKNLWYIARYQFWPNKPYAHLALTLTDRHETPRAYGPSDPVWKNRLLSNFTVKLYATSQLPSKRYIQYSTHFGGPVGEPWIDVIAAQGAPYQWFHQMDFPEVQQDYQVTHSSIGNGLNQVVWHPLFTGEADLEVNFIPYPAGWAYKQASATTYEIEDTQGTKTMVVPKDRFKTSPIALGRYRLDQDSTIAVKDAAAADGSIIANGLVVKPTDGRSPFQVKLGQRLADNVLTLDPYALIVLDLWQHHPIEVFSSGNQMGVKAILTPTLWMGGMGLTLDLGIVVDGSSEEALALIKAPPTKRELPPWWDPIDGTLVSAPEFDVLVNRTKEIMNRADESYDNYGWRNWGDYQIGWSYTSSNGIPVENWASGQYDLPTSLLLAYVRTGDPGLWQRARAAVRHAMDIDLVKFTPFDYKYGGMSHRKGECDVATSHVCTEPVSAFSDAWRGLLLYSYLSGEQWAKDLAQMQIDNSTYILKRDLNWVATWGSRDAAWILRSLIYGSKLFPEGTRYLSNDRSVPMPVGTSYASVLETGIHALLTEMNRISRYPGAQAVWMGQGVETLAEYHRMTNRDDIKQALLMATDFFTSPNASRQLEDGSYEFVYDGLNSNPPQPIWTKAGTYQDNYGWLWLSALTYAYDVTGNSKYRDFASQIYQYVYRDYTTKPALFESPRLWTSALGYPWLYVERFLGSIPASPLRGDANQDGVVNLRDAIQLLRWITGQPGRPEPGTDRFLTADVNRDGRLTLSDFICLLRGIMARGTLPC